MADGPILTARGLCGPRSTPRVFDIDMRLEHGGLLHIHGRSGSGKTTLLRLLSRLDPAQSGTLRLAGQDATEIETTTWRRRVCLVFQESRIFPGTIEENLQWGARLHGLHPETPHLLERVGLPLDPTTPAGQLSGGEAKRLAIARALAVGPDVLLLDEPTGPLDEDNRDALRLLIKRLLDDEQIGVILVSHLDEDLHLLPGHAMHLETGRIQTQGPSARLYQTLKERHG